MGQVVTLVRMSARTQLNVIKMRVGGCRWMDGNMVKGQVPLAVSKAVRNEAMELCR